MATTNDAMVIRCTGDSGDGVAINHHGGPSYSNHTNGLKRLRFSFSGQGTLAAGVGFPAAFVVLNPMQSRGGVYL